MERIAGVVLAGGRARRMGGGDKGVLRIGGVPILARVIARLAPHCAALAISANGDPARFAGFGLPVIADTLPDRPGPLAGVLAGLDWAAGQGFAAIVTAAADTPFLPGDLVPRLREAAGSRLALAASPDETGAVRLHPTCGLWPVALRHELRAALESGVRRAGFWAEGQGAARAVFASDPGAPDPFFNVNTPEDLAKADKILFTPPSGRPGH